jgi:hypothetical protein
MAWWDFGGEIEEGHPPPLAGLCALDFFEKWGGCGVKCIVKNAQCFSCRNEQKKACAKSVPDVFSAHGQPH